MHLFDVPSHHLVADEVEGALGVECKTFLMIRYPSARSSRVQVPLVAAQNDRIMIDDVELTIFIILIC